MTTAGHRPALVGSRAALAEALGSVARSGPVVLVPTMGALHEGHVALIRAARKLTPDGAVVVSVFVNPLQFAPGEDLARYPRTLDADLARCATEGVDAVFAPSVEEVYPDGEPQVTVDPGPLGEVLEGAVRAGHFRGVLTVVAKLFGLVAPQVAVFGEKDYQQLVLVRRMVADLSQTTTVVGVPTVREPDGLALSSRNRFLDAADRRRATALAGALCAGAAAGSEGPDAVLRAARAVLDEARLRPDYLELTGSRLGPVPETGEARLLVAARVGSTRLIDNLAVSLGR